MKNVPKKDISTLEFHDFKGQEIKSTLKVIRLFFKGERQYKQATDTLHLVHLLTIRKAVIYFGVNVHAISQCVTFMNEPVHEISNNVVCAISKYSDQPAHTRSLIRAFASRLNIL